MSARTPRFTAALDATAAGVLAPLDHVRARLLRGSGRFGRRLIADRQLRINTLALVGVATSLTLTALAPVWLLVFGPLILGVPHLLADVRYLVVRPGLHLQPRWWLACGVPLGLLTAGHTPWAGALAVVGGAAAARAPAWVWAGASALLGSAIWAPEATLWGMIHAHNLVAIGLWAAWRGGDVRRLVPVVAALAGYGAILTGALDGPLIEGRAILWGPASVSFGALFGEISGGLPHPWDIRLVASFAFLQSVHYAVWLRWIPEDDRSRYTPRPLVATYRALVADLGVFGLYAFGALAAVILGLAAVSLPMARSVYFSVASGHGWLELACIARLLAIGRRPC